jgi:ribose-phosphate pyrophosphokinase
MHRPNVSLLSPLISVMHARITVLNRTIRLQYAIWHRLFEAIGTDRFVAMDVHHVASFENAFRTPTYHLEAAPLLSAQCISGFSLEREELVVVSPDIGGLKRAQRFQAELEKLLQRDVPMAVMGKSRVDHVVGADDLVAGIADRTAVIIDEVVGTGETLAHAVAACRRGGARQIFAAATHGLFLSGAEAVVGDPNLDGVVVADTAPPFRVCSETARRKLTVVDSTALVAEVIGRLTGMATIGGRPNSRQRA